jgi:aspartate/methionine/tyrosine aminotransferase
MNHRQTLPIEHPDIKNYIEKLVNDKIEFDKRFVYYLLGSTGICVVPLTSFFTSLQGFRMTLLDKDPDRFEAVVKRIADKIVQYIDSSSYSGSLPLL